MTTQTSTSNYAMHIVEKQMPVDQLIMIMYNAPSDETYAHFKMVNSHINNGVVQIGQVVLLSPADTNECTREEGEFLKIANAVDVTLSKLANSEKELLVKRYDFLSNVASYNGLFLGVSNTAWNAHTNQVESILKDIERSYVSSYKTNGNINNRGFFAQRKIHFTRLDAALSRFMQPAFGGNVRAGDIRSNLGLSSRSIIHQWNGHPSSANTIPNFDKNYAAVAKMSQNLKRVGYLGIALTGLDATANIIKACESDDAAACSKAKYTQTGKAAVSIGGGMVGGYVASWAACSLVFSLPSGGTSFFWCTIVAGATGGIVGGKYGGDFGKKRGNILYEKHGVK